MKKCPLCSTEASEIVRICVYQYFECKDCEFIFVDPAVLESIDQGKNLIEYNRGYWDGELASAKDRSYGPALARVAETILYAREPITRFLDIGSGPGYLLDSLEKYLPASKNTFYGIELYPPPSEFRSHHPNYKVGELSSLAVKFQAGVCIEVLEHLTPEMAKNLAKEMASISDVDAIYLFNTGLVSYVKKEDPAYLDPFKWGHITSWSVKAAEKIFAPHGFAVKPIGGKTWAFVVEFKSSARKDEDIRSRIWTALPENKKILHDPVMGSILYISGLDAARAY